MDYMVKGKTLGFRLVDEEDAPFILELRQNENLGKHLSVTNITVDQQKEWIRAYKPREADKIEYYFRVDTLNGEPIGFLRIYNIDYSKKTFTWGSWIFKEGRPKTAAIESALMIYEFCFKTLGLEKAIYDVRKDNTAIIYFHTRFGSTIVAENDLDVFFELPKELYMKLRAERYENFLPGKEEICRGKSSDCGPSGLTMQSLLLACALSLGSLGISTAQALPLKPKHHGLAATYKRERERERERERRCISQYYFITETLPDNRPVGTVRLYNIDYLKKICTWGSFIMHPSRPRGATPEAIRLSLGFAFELGMERIILDVRKENQAAIRLYEFCGFSRYEETDQDYLYMISRTGADIHSIT